MSILCFLRKQMFTKCFNAQPESQGVVTQNVFLCFGVIYTNLKSSKYSVYYVWGMQEIILTRAHVRAVSI